MTIASGGVLPKIHPELLAKKRGGKFVLGNNMPLTVPYKKPIATKPMLPKKQTSQYSNPASPNTTGNEIILLTIVIEIVLTPVSYTHLDVYKRQMESCGLQATDIFLYLTDCCLFYIHKLQQLIALIIAAV